MNLTDNKMDIPISKKTRRTRSTGFPVISLEEAVELLETAKGAGLEMSVGVFAGEIEMSPKGSAFLFKLAALRDFKLIDKSSDKIVYSELARDILFDTSGNGEVKRAKLKEAFKNCKIFNDILMRLSQSGSESKKDTIGNIAVREFGVAPQSQSRFIKNFVDSGKFSDMLVEKEDSFIKVQDISGEITPEDVQSRTVSDTIVSSGKFEKKVFETGDGWSIDMTIRSSKPFPQAIRTAINTITSSLESDNVSKLPEDEKASVSEDNKASDSQAVG